MCRRKWFLFLAPLAVLFGTSLAAQAATLPWSTGFETGQPSNLTLVDSGSFPTLTSTTGTTLSTTPTTYTTTSRFQTVNQVVNTYGTVNPTGGSNFMMLDYPNGLSAGGYDFLFDLSGYNPATDVILLECNWVDCNDDDGVLDAIFLSDDNGATWVCPFNWPFSTAPDSQWNFLQLDLSAAATAGGLSFTNQFIVRFQASDDFDAYTGVDGLGLDDLAVFEQGDPEINLVDPFNADVPNNATVNLGNVSVGSPASLTWTVENLGASNPLDVTGITATPSGVANCSVNPNPALTPSSPVATSSSATFDTSVTPSAAGAFEYTIVVSSNDADEGTYTIVVQGSGVTPTLTVTNNNRPSAGLPPGVTNFVATSGNVSSNVVNQTVSSVTVTKAGSIADADITAVRLFIDANNNFIVDTGETQLGTDQTLSSGTATFSVSVPVTAPANVVVAVDLAGSSTGTIAMDVTGISVAPGTVTGLPVTGATHSLLTPVSSLPYSDNYDSAAPSNRQFQTTGAFPGGTGTSITMSNYTNAASVAAAAAGTATPVSAPSQLEIGFPSGVACGAALYYFDWSALNVATDQLIMNFSYCDNSDENDTEDGIFISLDGGTTWAMKLWDSAPTTRTDNVHAPYTVNITALLSSASLNFTNAVVIRIQGQDDSPYTTGNDGHAYDDLSFELLDDPEISVLSPASNSVASGDTVNVGPIFVGAQTTYSWTVENLGLTNNLNVTSISANPSGVANCSVNSTPVLTPSGAIAPQASATFDTDVTPTAAGAFEYTIIINNNDPDEGTYTLIVQGTGVVPQTLPWVEDFEGASPLSNWTLTGPSGAWHVTTNHPATGAACLGYVQNETQPSATPDGDYAFGAAANSGNALSPPIVIPTNGAVMSMNLFHDGEGSATTYDLVTIGISLSSTSPSFNTVLFGPSGADQSYTPLSFNLASFAGQTIHLMINFDTVDGAANNNAGPRIDDISITELDNPEINVYDPNTNAVASGATVNIGNAAIGAPTTFTWSIDNDGVSNDLIISALTATPTGVSNCSVNSNPVLTPASPIPAGNTASFPTDVTPTTVGVFEFTITITNNDPNEGSYTIIVQGNGVAPAANIQRPASNIISHMGTDTVTQNTSPSGATNVTWTVGNTGAGALAISSIVSSNASNCNANVSGPASSTVAPAGTTTFDVAITPLALGTWSFDITLNSNDPTTPAYTITVDGNATADPPSIQAPITPLGGSPIVITEFTTNTGGDLLEIMNVTNSAFDATGWQVIVSADYTNINLANAVTQTLGNFGPQQVQFWDDSTSSAQYWGSNIFWAPAGGTGWIMIVDPAGTVMDFVPFNWTAASISGMSVNAGGFTGLNPSAVWNGDGIVDSGGVYARQGSQDNDDVTDWQDNGSTNSWGTANPGLTLPWAGGAGATIGGAYPAYTGQVFIGDPLDVTFTADDPNLSDTLNFTVTVTGGTLTAAQAGFNETFPFTPTGGTSPHTATVTGTASAIGTIELTVQVTDGGLSDSYTYTITIDDPPEMDVLYNGAPVPDGSTVNQAMLNVGVTQFTFTIENSGGLDVNLTGTPLVEVTAGANLFSATVSQNPNASIPGSGSTTFTIDVTPNFTTGTYDFTVSIDNNDPNENPYDFTVTGSLTSNLPPSVTVPSGSNWVNAGGGLFTLTVDPTDTFNDSLEVNDGTPDPMTVAVTNPVTAMLGLTTQPLDVTVPTAGPIFLDWAGTVDASNAPGNFDWSIDISDGTTVVTITARIVLNDVDPQHTAATGITGDGSVATPYLGQFAEGDPASTFLDIANVSDPNINQTLTLLNVNRTGGTAAGGSGFTFSLAGGVLSANPTMALVANDVGTNIYTMEISDGTGTPVTINVTLTVLSATGSITFNNSSPLPAATVNQSYTVLLAVTGGTGPYTYALANATSLPVGLTLNTNTGEISGTPAATGVYTFDVRAFDSNSDTATMTFQLSVNSSSGGGGGGGGGGGCAVSDSTWPALLGILALLGIVGALRRRQA